MQETLQCYSIKQAETFQKITVRMRHDMRKKPTQISKETKRRLTHTYSHTQRHRCKHTCTGTQRDREATLTLSQWSMRQSQYLLLNTNYRRKLFSFRCIIIITVTIQVRLGGMQLSQN